jgi:hypothetical protein
MMQIPTILAPRMLNDEWGPPTKPTSYIKDLQEQAKKIYIYFCKFIVEIKMKVELNGQWFEDSTVIQAERQAVLGSVMK